jgi:tungstate transport system ATP-binding protein
LYQLENLRQTYGDRTVLDIPALAIEAGERCAVLGPNGAGKTTLLQLLAFLERPSAGTIRFRNQPVRFDEGRLQKLRRSVVMLEQHPILFSTTVYRNLEFGLKIRKIPPERRRRAIAEALDLVGMNGFVQQAAHKLSGGETQRIALARALVLEPEVLLCDEPTANVDQENQRAVVEILRRINEEKNITLIFSTHGRFQAFSLAQRTVHLDHGCLTIRGRDNLFRARAIRTEKNNCVYELHPGVRLALAIDPPKPAGQSIRVFLDPEKIRMGPLGEKSRMENHFQGRVIRTTQENDRVSLDIDIGIFLNLLISPDEYRYRKPLVGDSVGIIIPSDAIQWMH